MRRKTMYAERPDESRLEIAGASAMAVFCENIEEISTDDGSTQYQADEYTLPMVATANIAERFERNKDSWRASAIQADYDRTAEAVRKERDRLLEESDSNMILDRLGLEVPSGTTFSSWLSFLQSLGTVLKGDAAVYRQALRDLPQQEGFPYDVEWPEMGGG